MRVGLIGLGLMGRAMARRLIAAGYDVDVQYSSLVTDPWTSRA